MNKYTEEQCIRIKKYSVAYHTECNNKKKILKNKNKIIITMLGQKSFLSPYVVQYYGDLE